MEMHQVRYFLALSEELNFTKAAMRCHVSQPSLTRAIKLLEQEFGGLLLRRERGNSHLSELGKMVLPYLREVEAQSTAAKAQAEKLRKTSAHRLRLGVMCTIAPDPLLTLVGAIHSKHRDVDLEIIDESAANLEEQLVAGNLDVALYCRPDGPDEKLHHLKVFSERMVIVLHPNDPLAERERLSLTDLNEQKYLHRTNCEYKGPMSFGPAAPSGARDTAASATTGFWRWWAAGIGFSFLPEYCVNHPGVVARPLVEPEVTRQVDVVTVRGRPYSPAVGAVVREVMRNGWHKA